MSKPVLAHAAQTGFAASSAYDAHRPTYPPEAVSKLLNALAVLDVKGAKVADLAAGTGKFTALLAARPEKYEITAIEPHDGMRRELDQKKLQNVHVVDGTAENMRGISDGSFDAVVASQAFHWFANMDALREVHRVLKPTGVFGMIWNIEDYNAPRSWEIHPGWEEKIHALTWSFDDNHPRFRHEKWRDVFEEQTKSDPIRLHFADPLFSLPLGEGSVKFETWLTKDEIWKRYRTLSQVAVLKGEDLDKVQKLFFDAINDPSTETDDQGRVAVHGQTYFAWASQIPAEPLRSGG